MTGQLRAVRAGARVSASLLDATLAQVGIRPIPDDVVEEYMKDQLEKAPGSNFVGRLLDRLGVDTVSFHSAVMRGLIILGVIGMISAMVGILGATIAVVSQTFPAWPFLSLTAIGVVIAAGATNIFYGIYFNELPIEILGPARWVTMPSENMRWMPERVVNEMLRIQRHDPDIRFEVADLRQSDYSLDPVLFAILGDERRAVLVWNRIGIWKIQLA